MLTIKLPYGAKFLEGKISHLLHYVSIGSLMVEVFLQCQFITLERWEAHVSHIVLLHTLHKIGKLYSLIDTCMLEHIPLSIIRTIAFIKNSCYSLLCEIECWETCEETRQPCTLWVPHFDTLCRCWSHSSMLSTHCQPNPKHCPNFTLNYKAHN